MTVELSGQRALVTGAARGLGLCIAEDLAREGVDICGIDNRKELLSEEMQRLAGTHDVKTLALPADISIEAEVKNAVAEVFQQWGGIEILINNAAVRKVAAVPDIDTKMWDEIHSTNVRGPFLVTREVLKQGMLAANEGTIIFISSGSGKRGERNSATYCSSKFGVTGFAQSVAKDLKDTRIRVTTIFPGMIWTPMAAESEVADAGLDWLDAAHVSRAVVFCVQQDRDTIIPELAIYHRAQI